MHGKHVRIEISDSVMRTFVLAEDSITRLGDEKMIAAKFDEISARCARKYFLSFPLAFCV